MSVTLRIPLGCTGYPARRPRRSVIELLRFFPQKFTRSEFRRVSPTLLVARI
jgi:hypothetical protein